MKQKALQLKRRIRGANVLQSDFDARRAVLKTMLMSLAFLALLYTIILGNIVFDIVERRAVEKDALALTSEVSSMELSYLSLSKKVDLALSLSMGFEEIKPAFATRKTLGFSTGNIVGKSLVENEI